VIRSVSTCKGCSVGEAIGDRALGGMSPEVYVQFWLKPGDPPVELSIGDERQEEMIPEALRTYLIFKDRAMKEVNLLRVIQMKRPQRMIPAPTRHTTAPITSHLSGRFPSMSHNHISDAAI
jgi:hypothetical protein